MNANRREVVVTGMGAVSPFGVGVEPLWNGIIAGRSGVDSIEDLLDLDPAIYPVRYAAAVRNFCVDDYLKRHCEVRVEKSAQMGLVAAREALAQAGLLTNLEATVPNANPVAIVVGSGHGPCHEADAGYHEYFTRGPRAVRPATLAKSMFNSLSSNLSIHFGLTGANLVIASACSSGTMAIGLAAVLIRDGFVDRVLCGGALMHRLRNQSSRGGPICASWPGTLNRTRHPDRLTHSATAWSPAKVRPWLCSSHEHIAARTIGDGAGLWHIECRAPHYGPDSGRSGRCHACLLGRRGPEERAR